jgi:hypothetical protein
MLARLWKPAELGFKNVLWSWKHIETTFFLERRPYLLKKLECAVGMPVFTRWSAQESKSPRREKKSNKNSIDLPTTTLSKPLYQAIVLLQSCIQHTILTSISSDKAKEQGTIQATGIIRLQKSHPSELNEQSRRLSLCITVSIQSCACSLLKILHLYMKEIVRKMHTSGERATRLLKIRSFLNNHNDQAKQPKM